MLISLYQTSDSDNVIGKTLSDGITFNINLKRDTDLIQPTILLSRITGVEFNDYNYCHIPELKRYYFIRTISTMNASVYSLMLECDYLESYKDEILNSAASYRRPIQVGDYGEVNLTLTGRETVEVFHSDVELEHSNDAILSVLNGELMA